MAHQGYTDAELPCEDTVGNLLNRLDYRLKHIQKTKSVKKNADTDRIFQNIDTVRQEAEGRADILRISIETTAKVMLGEFSRKGKSRRPEAACDPDLHPTAVLAPFGRLDLSADLLTSIFGASSETSDCIADGLEWWWRPASSDYVTFR